MMMKMMIDRENVGNENGMFHCCDIISLSFA